MTAHQPDTPEATNPENCPICGTPFADTPNLHCDHEPDWYRQWITNEQRALRLALDTLTQIADGTADPTTIARDTRDAITTMRTA